jgi:hypothetical protein
LLALPDLRINLGLVGEALDAQTELFEVKVIHLDFRQAPLALLDLCLGCLASDIEIVRLDATSVAGECVDIFAHWNVSRMLDPVHQFLAVMSALLPDVFLWSLSSLIGSSRDTRDIFDDVMRTILQFAGKSLIGTPKTVFLIGESRLLTGTKPFSISINTECPTFQQQCGRSMRASDLRSID